MFLIWRSYYFALFTGITMLLVWNLFGLVWNQYHVMAKLKSVGRITIVWYWEWYGKWYWLPADYRLSSWPSGI